MSVLDFVNSTVTGHLSGERDVVVQRGKKWGTELVGVSTGDFSHRSSPSLPMCVATRNLQAMNLQSGKSTVKRCPEFKRPSCAPNRFGSVCSPSISVGSRPAFRGDHRPCRPLRCMSVLSIQDLPQSLVRLARLSFGSCARFCGSRRRNLSPATTTRQPGASFVSLSMSSFDDRCPMPVLRAKGLMRQTSQAPKCECSVTPALYE